MKYNVERSNGYNKTTFDMTDYIIFITVWHKIILQVCEMNKYDEKLNRYLSFCIHTLRGKIEQADVCLRLHIDKDVMTCSVIVLLGFKYCVNVKNMKR